MCGFRRSHLKVNQLNLIECERQRRHFVYLYTYRTSNIRSEIIGRGKMRTFNTNKSLNKYGQNKIRLKC